jgi:hypothetical protein
MERLFHTEGIGGYVVATWRSRCLILFCRLLRARASYDTARLECRAGEPRGVRWRSRSFRPAAGVVSVAGAIGNAVACAMIVG